MTTALERRLRRHLVAVDDAPLTRAAIDELGEPRPRRSRLLVVAGAALVVVAGLGAAAWSGRGRDGHHVATSTTVEPCTWVTIPPDPRGPTIDAQVVWTGAEAIVVGGSSPSGGAREGIVAYRPDVGSWRRLADPPAGWVGRRPLVAWTGTEVLAIGGDGTALPQAASAYDPTTDTWREITPAPTAVVGDGAHAWTGQELLVVTPDGSWAFDPSADHWRPLAPSPLGSRVDAVSVWTGSNWLVWGGLRLLTADPEGDGARYDPTTDTWTPMATRQGPGATRGAAAWTGSELIVLDSWSDAASAAYDPRSDTWRALPAHPRHALPPVWTGRVVATIAEETALTYDPASDAWVQHSCAPAPVVKGSSVVWTGRAVLIIGSADRQLGGSLLVV